VIISCRI